MNSLVATTSWIKDLEQVPLAWKLLWLGFLSLSVALIILVGTRWGQTKQIQKCAVLSLVAHLLLGCLATTIRIVNQHDEQPVAAPMHIRVVHREAEEATKEVATSRTEPWEFSEESDAAPNPASLTSRPEQKATPKLPSPTPATADVDLARPPIEADPHDSQPEADSIEQLASANLPPRTPTTIEETEEKEPPSDVEPAPPSIAMSETDRPAIQETELVEFRPEDEFPLQPEDFVPSDRQAEVEVASDTEVLPEQPTPLTHSPRPATNIDAEPLPHDSQHPVNLETTAENKGKPPHTDIPAVVVSDRVESSHVPRELQGRLPELKETVLIQFGGNQQTEQAVMEALEWLSRSQSRDGRWNARRHGAGREMMVLGHDRSGAGVNADTAVTGLALLAFLGAGETPASETFGPTVENGLHYLVSIQQANGDLAGSASLFARMYSHSMATLALAEAYAMTADSRWRRPLELAIHYSVSAQHPSGSWRYRPGEVGDTSQLGWKLLALSSAERSGIAIDDAIWTRAESFLHSVSVGRFAGLASYRPGEPISKTMTAEASLCRMLVLDRLRRHPSQAQRAEAAAYLQELLPGEGRDNFYYWYYATLFLHARQRDTVEAERDWQRWNDALQRRLLSLQKKSGPLAGSWDAGTVWGGYGGRVYATAMGALIFESYYRYMPNGVAAVANQPPLPSPSGEGHVPRR